MPTSRNNKKNLVLHWSRPYFWGLIISVSGCISLPFNNSPSESETKVRLEVTLPQSSPFSIIEKEKNMITLKSRNTGSIIFVRALCPKHHDRLIQSFIESMENVEVTTDSQPLLIDQRIAQRRWIRGIKENFSYHLEVIQFEKYSCQNSLVFLAQEKYFHQEIQTFRQLITSLRVTL
ncbi:MAG: hypothetical protein NZ480_03945 [Bdellovibrionaceae bacterium]|nr:hypothetical protein [Pseudobdellovibrionaceae bacterium]MDW8190554.1 hypothetical protein [Pseudobdellovibrionaceae bacterium]